jgi:metal-sulfur cluster biosynthetic enzyme
MRADRRTQVDAALDRVHDPCSVAAQSPLSVRDMGLLRGWELADGGVLDVRICVTTHACTMLGHIVRGIEAAAGEVDGVSEVRVTVERDVLWGEELMTPEGRALLAGNRRRARELTGVRPRQWKDAA